MMLNSNNSFELLIEGVTGGDLFSVAPAQKSLLEQKVAPPASPLADPGPTMLDPAFAECEFLSLSLPDEPSALLLATSKDVAVTPPTVVADDLMGGEDMPYLDDFTNLSNFLFTDTENMMGTNNPSTETAKLSEESDITVTVVSSTDGVNRKRTATEAFLDNVSVSTMNPDHFGYVCKKPLSKAPETIVSVATSPTTATTTAEKNSDNKYRERRTKNNVASRRSRESKKQKVSAMEIREKELEASNIELEKTVEELEALAKMMKDVLVKRLT